MSPMRRIASPIGPKTPPRSHEYEVIGSALYDQPQLRKKCGELLANIFRKTGLPPKPITAHSVNDRFYLHASKQWEYLFALQYIDSVSPGEQRSLRIVDLGSGRAALAPFLSLCGHKVTTFDIAYHRHGEDPRLEDNFRAWAGQQRVKVRLGSLFEVPVRDNSFDVVLSMSVVEHVRRKDRALKEALRILKPDGVMIMSFDLSVDVHTTSDAGRIEILNPNRLGNLLGKLEIRFKRFTARAVRQSIAHAQQDGVLDLPRDLTVGAIAIRKSVKASH